MNPQQLMRTKKIRHVEKRKLKYGKEHTERNPKTARRLDCNRCGAPNWSKQHDCLAKGKKCAKCGKLGHFAKCCRSGRKINHIADEEAYSADADEWTQDRIHSIQQKSTHWAMEARTDHRSIPKRYWSITDQSNSSSIQAHQ